MDRGILELSNNPAGKNIRLIWAIVAGSLLLALVSLILSFKYYGQGSSLDDGVEIKQNQYQAVFMEGGQVYFGKLKISQSWLILEDIYYLQVSGSSNIESGQNLGTNFQLVKLGSEIHGPEDVMYIDPENVIYWENIRDDSQVVQAIVRAKQ